MAIYTKRGDKGETSLFDEKSNQKKRIDKDSLTVAALGSIDELNSFLGVCVSYCDDEETIKRLESVQKNLLRIGSIIAGSNLRFTRTQTKRLEKTIDGLEGKLPVLKNFILPGGTKLASHLHYSRSLARKVERNLVSLDKEKEVKPQILSYVNRLSDYLFMLAREESHKKGKKQTTWKGGK